jgi:hypothetical protein
MMKHTMRIMLKILGWACIAIADIAGKELA